MIEIVCLLQHLRIVYARRGCICNVHGVYASIVDWERLATMVGRASISFDKYATRPTLCAQATYVFSKYDRLINLRGRGPVMMRSALTVTSSSKLMDAPINRPPPALHGFLHKLLGLAAMDA
jgi:hypothetical protein